MQVCHAKANFSSEKILCEEFSASVKKVDAIASSLRIGIDCNLRRFLGPACKRGTAVLNSVTKAPKKG